MPSLTQHQAGESVKMLFIGESGSGKSGALAALALAGYRLVILDIDNGLDILFHLLKGKPEAENVFFETCNDKLKTVAGVVIPDSTPKAWTSAMALLTHWKMAERKDEKTGVVYPAYDLGKLEDWRSDTILVIDSLTFLSQAAMRHVLAINGRSGKTPFQSDWGEAMRLIEDCLGLLYGASLKCHLIINTHIDYISNEADQALRGMPMALGKKLPPKIGRYFNTVVLAKSSGSGAGVKRQIHTSSQGLIELKTPAPGKVQATYPLETGLADLFKVLLSN